MDILKFWEGVKVYVYRIVSFVVNIKEWKYKGRVILVNN